MEEANIGGPSWMDGTNVPSPYLPPQTFHHGVSYGGNGELPFAPPLRSMGENMQPTSSVSCPTTPLMSHAASMMGQQQYIAQAQAQMQHQHQQAVAAAAQAQAQAQAHVAAMGGFHNILHQQPTQPHMMAALPGPTTMAMESLMPAGTAFHAPNWTYSIPITKKVRGGGVSCHHCKISKDKSKLYFCTNTSKPGAHRKLCKKKVCQSCMKRVYPEYEPTKPEQLETWLCPSCLGVCTCAACVSVRSMAASSEAKQAAQAAEAAQALQAVKKEGWQKRTERQMQQQQKQQQQRAQQHYSQSSHSQPSSIPQSPTVSTRSVVKVKQEPLDAPSTSTEKEDKDGDKLMNSTESDAAIPAAAGVSTAPELPRDDSSPLAPAGRRLSAARSSGGSFSSVDAGLGGLLLATSGGSGHASSAHSQNSSAPSSPAIGSFNSGKKRARATVRREREEASVQAGSGSATPNPAAAAAQAHTTMGAQQGGRSATPKAHSQPHSQRGSLLMTKTGSGSFGTGIMAGKIASGSYLPGSMMLMQQSGQAKYEDHAAQQMHEALVLQQRQQQLVQELSFEGGGGMQHQSQQQQQQHQQIDFVRAFHSQQAQLMQQQQQQQQLVFGASIANLPFAPSLLSGASRSGGSSHRSSWTASMDNRSSSSRPILSRTATSNHSSSVADRSSAASSVPVSPMMSSQSYRDYRGGDGMGGNLSNENTPASSTRSLSLAGRSRATSVAAEEETQSISIRPEDESFARQARGLHIGTGPTTGIASGDGLSLLQQQFPHYAHPIAQNHIMLSPTEIEGVGVGGEHEGGGQTGTGDVDGDIREHQHHGQEHQTMHDYPFQVPTGGDTTMRDASTTQSSNATGSFSQQVPSYQSHPAPLRYTAPPVPINMFHPSFHPSVNLGAPLHTILSNDNSRSGSSMDIHPSVPIGSSGGFHHNRYGSSGGIGVSGSYPIEVCEEESMVDLTMLRQHGLFGGMLGSGGAGGVRQEHHLQQRHSNLQQIDNDDHHPPFDALDESHHPSSGGLGERGKSLPIELALMRAASPEELPAKRTKFSDLHPGEQNVEASMQFSRRLPLHGGGGGESEFSLAAMHAQITSNQNQLQHQASSSSVSVGAYTERNTAHASTSLVNPNLPVVPDLNEIHHMARQLSAKLENLQQRLHASSDQQQQQQQLQAGVSGGVVGEEDITSTPTPTPPTRARPSSIHHHAHHSIDLSSSFTPSAAGGSGGSDDVSLSHALRTDIELELQELKLQQQMQIIATIAQIVQSGQQQHQQPPVHQQDLHHPHHMQHLPLPYEHPDSAPVLLGSRRASLSDHHPLPQPGLRPLQSSSSDPMIYGSVVGGDDGGHVSGTIPYDPIPTVKLEHEVAVGVIPPSDELEVDPDQDQLMRDMEH